MFIWCRLFADPEWSDRFVPHVIENCMGQSKWGLDQAVAWKGHWTSSHHLYPSATWIWTIILFNIWVDVLIGTHMKRFWQAGWLCVEETSNGVFLWKFYIIQLGVHFWPTRNRKWAKWSMHCGFKRSKSDFRTVCWELRKTVANIFNIFRNGWRYSTWLHDRENLIIS